MTVLLAACVLLGGCESGSSGEEGIPQLKVHVTDVLTIGLEQHEHDLLGDPRSVRVDSEGRILIADRSMPVIRVYDRQGTWLYDIGARGEGPEEFVSIDVMEMIGEDSLLVIDGMGRRANIVHTDGTFLDFWTLTPDDDVSVWPTTILPLDSDRQVVEGSSFVGTDPSVPQPTEFLHYVRLEEEGYRIEQSFACRVEDLGFEGGFGATAPSIGSVLLRNGEEILYSHHLYDGVLYRFVFDVTEDRWQQAGTWEGINSVKLFSDRSYWFSIS